ncbi:hypothetical protein [Photobacterium leiognathi]|uniref:hypothetical protein n=1 Tax=Photobacterium leiognathi TaxID=553611 RepID=UPI002981902B|nr:hypothetical protein [Photobacterium leiognathi]
MSNQLNLTPAFIAELAEKLIADDTKEVKGKVKMGIWLVRQNAKHEDLEDHLESEVYNYDVLNENGVAIRKVSVFVAVDSRDNTVLFTNLLTRKFGNKFRKELEEARKKRMRTDRYVAV